MAKVLDAKRGVYAVYGTRPVGGASGRFNTLGATQQAVFDIDKDTIADPMKVKLPPRYLVTGLFLEVEEAFAAGAAANISINSGAGLTTALDLAVLGQTAPALTGLANTAGGSTSADAVVTPDAEALASTTGKARLVVEYRRV
jgi:hypothetical protein